MQLSERLARGVKATFASRIVATAANGLLIFLLTRYLLDPNEYGLLFLTLSIVAVAQLFADLGVARSGARYVAEFKESDPAQVPHIIATSLRYRLVLIGIVGGALVLGRDLAVTILDEPELGHLLVLGVAFLALQSLTLFNSVLFQGFTAVRYSALLNVVSKGSRVGFVVGFVSLGWGVVGALLGYVVSVAVATAIGLVILYTRFYRTFDPADAIEEGLRRRIAEYSVPLTASRGANVIDKQVDIVLVGFFLNPSAVAFYTLAKQISQFVMAPAGSIGFAVSPAYGEDKANERLDRAARIYETTLQYVLLLYVPAAVGLLLVAEPAILLVFGSEYAGAIPVVRVLSAYIVFQAVTNITTQGIDYLGRARYRAITKGLTSLANFGLNLLLIPMMGVAGAAFATVATFGVYTLANVYIMYVELPLRFDRILRIAIGAALISTVMGGCLVFLAPHISGYPSLAGVVAFGALVWGVLATASGLLDIRQTISYLT